MGKFRLELYQKYKGLLERAFPTYTENQLQEYFEIKVDIWESVVENMVV